MLCAHIMHGEFSGTFPDYTIFVSKFKTDECFLFMNRFQFINWRHSKIVRRQSTLLKKSKTLRPLFMDGVQLPQGQRHFEEAVYFFPLSPQKFLVLTLPRKDERLSRPCSHPVVLNTRPMDWESSTLITTSLLHKGGFHKGAFIIAHIRELYLM